MSGEKLYLKMLGGFDLKFGDQSISGDGSHARKHWQILAYLICNRGRAVTQEELLQQIFAQNDKGAGALRTSVHRLRAALDGLCEGMGHSFILSGAGKYSLGDFPESETDTERFCDLFRRAQSGELADMLEAEAAYGGEFMQGFEGEGWTKLAAAFYREMYVSLVLRALPALEQAGQTERLIEMAQRALEQEPFSEDIFRHLMRAFLQAQRQQEAIAAYERFRRLLQDEFGISPSMDIDQLYLSAIQDTGKNELRTELAFGQINEGQDEGCTICDYEAFKLLCSAQAQMISTSGEKIHNALFTLHAPDGAPLPPRSLGKIMDKFQDTLRAGLRRGDIVSKCAPDQFIVMLHNAGYEDSRAVCRRLMIAFSRENPGVPAKPDYSVWTPDAEM